MTVIKNDLKTREISDRVICKKEYVDRTDVALQVLSNMIGKLHFKLLNQEVEFILSHQDNTDGSRSYDVTLIEHKVQGGYNAQADKTE